MKLLRRKAGEPSGRVGVKAWRTLAARAVTVGLGLVLATAAHAQTVQTVKTEAPGQPSLKSAERTALEQHVQGLIAETLRRRAVRHVADTAVERDAKQLAAALSDAQLRAAFDREDASAVIDAALARAAAPASAAPTLGDSNSDLLYVPIPPCRIIDTRLAGGALAANSTRAFKVNGTDEFQTQGGNQGGCGIPVDAAVPQATAAVLNFVAVGPQGPGDLRAWAFGQSEPLAAVLNYSNVPGLNIANGVVVPIAGSSMYTDDLNVATDVSGTHLVVDVTGYFTRFPVEGFKVSKPSTNQSDAGVVNLGATSLQSCLAVNSCDVTTTVTGHVVVQTWAQVSVDHTQGTHDRVVLGIKNVSPTQCTNFNETVNAVDFEVPDVVPTDPAIEMVLEDARTFFQSAANGTVTYYVNAAMGIGASAGDQISSSRMVCTFYPD